MSKQKTLFQSWGNQKQKLASEKPSTEDTTNDVVDLCDSFEDGDDDLLCEAEFSTNGLSVKDEIENPNNISIGADGFAPTQGESQNAACPGFDMTAGKLWIYPTNYPVREYQFNIVNQSLFKNTMVTLPTGLGKTFIAAVVMYNFYRWYPQGKVIFMAPTKPLVAQQIEACYNIMGIPQDHTAEMTGSMGPPKREKAWHEKRVFFLTPQVLTNDLSRGSCPAHFVKCLVIDEAHKALGNHAYCQVVRELIKYTEQFRVLALSATPGSDIKAVQQVLSNLLISHIEIRTEDSIDIKQYSHERIVDKVVVPLGDELTKVKAKYICIMDMVVTKLKRHGVLYNRDTTSLSKFLILKARDAFRQNPPERLQRSQYGIVEGDFALAMSLYHGFELLQLHGSRSLYNFLEGILTGDKGYGRTRTELSRNGDFNELIDMLRQKYSVPQGDTPSQAHSRPFVIGHPKMEKLQEIVLEHFKKFEASNATTRVMIFSQYRDSVQEITDMLNLHRPLVKVMSFIGQSSAGKSTKGFTQKEQLKVMKEFREGGYNTLVSTCVGEEGLDIGDVDLIICFDAHKSPIRLVQRMGRTGRKREGRIVMLVTEGKEEQIYNQSQYSKRSIHRAILNGAKSLHFYQHSVRMVPDSINPVVHKMHITVSENFKPTKKLNTDLKPEKTAKISNLFSKDKQDVSDGLITREEYEELKPWLVPEENIPKLHRFDFGCLSKDQESTEEAVVPQGCFLSLSEWSPWQTTLQETSDRIDHSMQAKHYVELMELIQLQSNMDKDADPYGLEMAAYLNEEDIHSGEKENSSDSIARFCVSTTCEDGSRDAPQTEESKAKDPKPRKRHSDMLPTFNLEVNELDEESEDELPPIPCLRSPNRNDDDKLLKNKESTHCVPESNNFGEIASDIMLKDGEKSHVKDSGFGQSDSTVASKKDTMSKSKNRKSDKVLNSKAKILDQKMKRNMKIGKHKRVSGFNRSVIELLKVTDENDFDSTPPDKSTSKATLDNHVDLTSDDCVVKMESSVKYTEDSLSPNRKNYQRQYVIRTPPTVEDAIRHCESADLETDRVKIDLLEVIDEWHRENENGKYLVLLSREDSRYSYDTVNSSKKVLKMSKSISDICINPVAIPENSVQCKEKDKINGTKETKDITSKYNTPKSDSVSTRTFICDREALVKNEISGVKKKSELDSSDLLSAIDTNQDVELSGSFTPLIPDDVENIVDQKDRGIDSMTNSERFRDQRQQIAKSTKMFDSDHEKAIDASHNFNVAPDKNKTITNGVNVEEKSSVTKDGKNKKLRKISDILELGIKASTKKKNSTKLHDKVDIVMSEWGIEDSDDDLFGNFSTPDISCVKEASSPRFSRDSNTQFTFTQALNCLHSGSIPSESGSSMETNVHKECSNDKEVVAMNIESHRLSTSDDCTMLDYQTYASRKTGKEFTNNDLYKNLDSKRQLPFTSNTPQKQLPDTCTKNNLRNSSTSSDEGEQPQFDLGFDIDEDIIPPSPNTSQPLQCAGKNCLSQTFTSRLSQGRLTSNLSCDGSKSDQNTFTDTNVDMCHNPKSKRSLRLDENCFTGLRLEPLEEEKESQSLLDKNRSKYVMNKIDFNSIRNLTKKDKPVIQRPSESEENFVEIGTCNSENIVNSKGGKTLGKTEEVTAMENDFETSFALVDDDFDEWFVNDAEQMNVDVNKNSDTKDTSFDKLTAKTVNDEKTIDVTPTCITITNRGKTNTTLDQSTKKKKHLVSHSRKSVFCPDLSFEDSFSFHDNCGDRNNMDNVSNSVIPRKLENTSTPMAKNSTVKVNLSSPVITPVECKKLKKPANYSDTASFEEEAHVDDDMDDSFVIRKRRKKPAQLESPISQVNVQSAGKMKEINKQFVTKYNEKTVNADMNWSEDDDFDDRLLMKNNNYFHKRNSVVHINSDTEEDFGKVPGMHKSDDKTNIGNTKKLPSSRSKKHVEVKRKSKSKRSSNPFLEEEAEISEDEENKATSDETDASDLDQYDDSFIHDSQFSQSQGLDQTDIQALYLKSVKSPVNERGGFKLQYNHKNVDVYSQVPKEDESQYMEDSFCVGSEEDDWLVQDNYHGEITVCHNQSAVLQSGKKRRKGVSNLQTGRQRAIHFGRIKALNEIKSKLAKKGKCNVLKKDKSVQSKQGTVDNKQKLSRTTRIKILEESSSDEEMNVTDHAGGNVMSPILEINKKRKRVMLLSSSDEEIQKPKLVCSQQSQHTGKMPWIVSLNQNNEGNGKSVSEVELGCDVYDNDTSSDEFGNKQHSADDKKREERIQKQKVQQEEFKRKMVEANIKKIGSVDQCIDIESLEMTMIKDISSKEALNVKGVRDFDDTSLLLNQNPIRCNNACILVDSKEISGAQDIISNLRFKHKIRVSAAQLPGCDYIVSNRMAVERKQWSDFSNGANRTKLIERIQHLKELYDRPCLIIEKDRVKSDDGKSEKPVHWTKYIDRTCAMLLKSNIKLLFTDTQMETASVLADLCLLEKRKDMDITVPVDLGPLKTDMVKFYASFPKLSYVHALNLCDGFKSISQFLKSPVAEIERKGKMSTSRATEVFNHIRRNFDLAMLPTKHK